jgi:hypothetical protein
MAQAAAHQSRSRPPAGARAAVRDLRLQATAWLSHRPARGPPTDWDQLDEAHDDRDGFQESPDELSAITIHGL